MVASRSLFPISITSKRVFSARALSLAASSRRADSPKNRSREPDEFGVSRERVRQIGVCAFEKVQKSVKKRVAVMENSGPLPAH